MTAGTHYLRAIAGEFAGSYALLSEADDPVPDTAVVFVHGFWGDSEGTWLHFQWMVDTYADQHPWWRGCDLYFYDYPSFSDAILTSAHRLLKFLDGVFPSPPLGLLMVNVLSAAGSIYGPQARLPQREYKRLVLIGHSQGALVIRRAVLQRAKEFQRPAQDRGDMSAEPKRATEKDPLLDDEYQMLRARLALFAPAIRGFTPSGWVGVALKLSRVGKLAELLLSASPSFGEMQDKTVANDLREDTNQLTQKVPWMRALAADILYGERDHFVGMGEYFADRTEPPEPGQGHASICKPTPRYHRPLEFVSERKRSAYAL
jgi:pimeloyl-ACP methyl ester carboxylesterase